MSKIYSFTTESHEHLKHLAETLGIPCIFENPTPEQLQLDVKRGAQAILSLGYPEKISVTDELSSHAHVMNVHMSLLPKGGGITPLPHVLTKYPEYCGFTVHILTPEFDAGDILYQEAIPLLENEDIHTLTARITLKAGDALVDLFKNLPDAFANAKPQDLKQKHWLPPSSHFQELDLTLSAKEIQKRLKAFGQFGIKLSLAQNETFIVTNATAWQEPHTYEPGSLIAQSGPMPVFALKDGYLLIKSYLKE